MNPRVSRSSALASKATGFPIAKIAARLAVGYTLDEIPNDITRKTPASFEPTIDYVVTKVPRWAFEKLPGTTGVLGTQMQSVGEAMAIGRTFPESFQKGLRSLESGRLGLNCDPGELAYDGLDDDELLRRCGVPTPERPFALEAALRRGLTVEQVHDVSKVDPWFLDQILAIVEERAHLASTGFAAMSRRDWRRAKRLGFGDAQLAWLWGVAEAEVRAARLAAGVRATFKTVDTCAAEFEASTPYHYSTYEDADEVEPSDRPKVVILGSGPNRIGQGIEFDYCCVHASFALRDAGYETVMVNCNPETVSTDYDTSDRLYFEPLTREDVLNVIEAEQAAAPAGAPPLSVIVALGGQTPLKLSGELPRELVVGTSPDSIDRAEDRDRWNALCAQLEIPQPPGGTATTLEQAFAVTDRVGFPVLVRPSYVLGGRAMRIVYDRDDLAEAMAHLAAAGSLGREGGLSAERPVLIDRFLEDAVEVDVDAIRDATGEVLIGGVMEHVEEAGVHSGDSACAIPPPTLPRLVIEVIERHTRAIAEALDVRGLVNVQYAVKQGQVFVLEANPRASRTVPFVAKATGVAAGQGGGPGDAGQHAGRAADRRAAERAGQPGARRGEGGGAALQPLPRGRHPPRPRDALHRRGDGHRRQLRAGLRQEPDRGRQPAARLGHGVLLAHRPRQGSRHPGGPAVRRPRVLAGRDRGHRRAPRGPRRPGRHGGGQARPAPGGRCRRGRVARRSPRPRGRRGAADGRGQDRPRRQHAAGQGSRADGDQIRRAATVHKVSCLTTVPAALAAARSLAERVRHPLKVRSLQEFHARPVDDQLRLGI